ncbi:MAG TPA: thioredoxin-like domain-containing protein [Pyrinomonadaceae bacterium]|nr:thioredoxin-like domain-containing protein [Pyrinomonadaceae bacterium]
MALQEKARVRAPEITGGRGWLNTDKPLSIAGLKGKVVLLDFWTYGCINCMHIIPDLKRLEHKYANQLVVIGVHSAKFENEKETENIRRIILRYEIEHPVYNDADFNVWRNYTVTAWPTQVLIDPAGYIIGGVSGEGNYDLLDQVIAKTIDEFRKRGELNEQPLRLALERAKVGALPLSFPGKILADAKNDRLFIADSDHNRIVITKLDGTLIETAGTGERGANDGSFETATLYRPQGMALDGDVLYVADTENHLIRQLDLKARTVQTVAGTGQQSHDYFKSGPALTIGLNSPWDLQLVGRKLYIAMAGPHQIWQLDLEKNEVSTVAGSGKEARQDGELLTAGFAQPSGITSDGKNLYTADSEANIIREIDLNKHEVRTLAGGDLFDFGDKDGQGDQVRLQHPLGIVSRGSTLLIADTYNHKIKELDPKTRSVKTFVGTGKSGQVDGASPSFYEPGGLSIANGKLYVADTNNHAIRVIDLKTKQASTLPIKGLEPPAMATAQMSANDLGPNGEEIKVALQKLRTDSDTTLTVNVDLPDGYHLNVDAPQRYRVSIESGPKQLGLTTETATGATGRDQVLTRSQKNLKLPIMVPLHVYEAGAAEVRVQFSVVYCREDNTGTCRIKTIVWRVPIEVSKDQSAGRDIKLEGRVTAE